MRFEEMSEIRTPVSQPHRAFGVMDSRISIR